MAKKKETQDVCPACGSSETDNVEWSGELANERTYNGPWVECCNCGLQGPAIVWDRMAFLRRRYALPNESWMELVRRCAALVSASPEEPIRFRSKVNTENYRPVIQDFAEKMLAELEANDSQKGNFLSWHPTEEQAFSELEHHVMKLAGALNRKQPKLVSEYCADIGNILLATDLMFGSQKQSVSGT